MKLCRANMKLLLIIGFAAFVAAANAFKDPCICTREYMPVCGTDGVTYGNKCMLNCEKQTKNHDLEIAHEGPCDEHREEIEDAAQKHCICPFLWAPVCGTNGRTYPNDCVFKCHQDEDKDVKIAHPGVCKGFPNIQENEHKKPCVCTMEWRPVCGTDGRTYGNKCAFNCEKRDSNPDLEIAHEGPCDEHREEIEKSAQKPCICTMEWMPVCGTDGKTYGNKCELGCAVRNTNPELEIAHEGPCGEKQLEELKATPCICPYIWAPECGTDGRTYPNECVLKCENRGNNEVKVAHHGVCAGFPSEQEDEEDLQEMRDPCACDRVLHPVCGSDGKTYNNRCLLRCAKLTGNPELEQVHEGPCEQEELLKDPCVCTREYRPVCGTDGVTYPNPCELRCAAVDKPELKQLHNGPCEEETEAAEMRDPCICPKIYYPVCGSDGKTYSNPCTLRCAASTNPKLQLVHFGECKQETEEEFNELFRNPCVCNKMLRPVCGSDGRTYSNPCRLNCAKETRDHALTLVHYGACESKAYEQSLIPTTDVCKCPLMLLLVCGSDGKTYANPCELKCRQRLTNKNLQMVHMGPCREEAYEEAVLEKHPKPCACNRMLLPVCGSDGVTYANPCLLNCAKRSNPELEMVRYGPCIQNHFEEFEENEVCACNRMWYPVCGTDGKTYANPCLLKCAQKNGKPNLEVRHVGECKHEEAVDNDECFCGDFYRPVCAREGDKLITFTNVCRYSCAARNNPNLSFEKHTACDEDQTAVELNELTSFCTLEYAPVCGTDGHTYGNLCFLKAAARHHEGLTVAHTGTCEGNTILAEEKEFCNCPENIWKPVCGTDLHTYPNMCEFKCAVKQNPGLKLLYPMVCIIMS